MKTALIIIGTFSMTALVAGLVLFIAYKMILWYFEPEAGSNAEIKNWLLNNPEKSIEQFPR